MLFQRFLNVVSENFYTYIYYLLRWYYRKRTYIISSFFYLSKFNPKNIQYFDNIDIVHDYWKCFF